MTRTILTPDGELSFSIWPAPNKPTAPVIFFLMDGVGIRPELEKMAERLSQLGYFVVLPNLYYRAGKYEPFNAKTCFEPGSQERDRLMQYVAKVENGKTAHELSLILDSLKSEPTANTDRVGLLGYCLGGRIALFTAAHIGDNIRAVAAIHGGGLITDKSDSPHRHLAAVRGEVYIGAPEFDNHFKADERALYDRLLTEAKIAHTVDYYPGVYHGFAIADLPVYDKSAAERHWLAITELFQRTLN
ncbi:MAG: dienelactone hydrolase family protein [Spirochaetes bacterium]|nr:dienelactone hydrolase family protein [Spirochaetota bacterium]